MTSETHSTGERADLLATLASHRGFLRRTVHGLDDVQAGERPTASALCLGGIIRHVADVEATWAEFIVEGPAVMSFGGGGNADEWADRFSIPPGETLAGLLERYEEVGRRTDELVAGLSDFDASQPLPEAPWFEKGARWSARRVLLHIIAETAQHAGHADIIRETIDGSKTMG